MFYLFVVLFCFLINLSVSWVSRVVVTISQLYELHTFTVKSAWTEGRVFCRINSSLSVDSFGEYFSHDIGSQVLTCSCPVLAASSTRGRYNKKVTVKKQWVLHWHLLCLYVEYRKIYSTPMLFGVLFWWKNFKKKKKKQQLLKGPFIMWQQRKKKTYRSS